MSDERQRDRVGPEGDGVPDSVRELAEQMRELRARSGLTLTSLAARTDVSKSSWERYLNCKKFPPRTAVLAFARAINVRPDRLLLLWDLAARTRVRAARGTRAETSSPGRSVEEPTAEPSPEGAPAPDRADAASRGGESGQGESPRPARSRAARSRAEVDHVEGSRAEVDHVEGARVEGARAEGVRAGGAGRADGASPASGAPADTSGRRWFGPRALHSRKGALAGASAMALLLGAAWILAPAGSPDPTAREAAHSERQRPTPRCVGFECLGRDAHAQRCADGAWTAATAELDGAYIELRYSPECRAAWARLSHADVGDTVRVVRGGKDHSEKRTISYDRDTYSPMVEAPYPGAVRACAARPGEGARDRKRDGKGGGKVCTAPGGATPLPYRPPRGDAPGPSSGSAEPGPG